LECLDQGYFRIFSALQVIVRFSIFKIYFQRNIFRFQRASYLLFLSMEALLEDSEDLLQLYLQAKKTLAVIESVPKSKDNQLGIIDTAISAISTNLRETRINRFDCEFKDDYDDGYSLVKNSVQLGLNQRVLRLERQNYQLGSQLSELKQLRNKTSSQELFFVELGICKVRSVLNSWRKKKKTAAFFKLLLAAQPITTKTESTIPQERPCQSYSIPKPKFVIRAMNQQDQSDNETLMKQLVADNARLKLELKDRSRAAELLCKRLLKVDATARFNKLGK